MSVRLLFWIVLIWGAFMLLRRFQRRSNTVRNVETSPPDHTAIDMVRCARCGMHLSRDQAVAIPSATGPQYYCSTEHARL